MTCLRDQFRAELSDSSAGDFVRSLSVVDGAEKDVDESYLQIKKYVRGWHKDKLFDSLE